MLTYWKGKEVVTPKRQNIIIGLLYGVLFLSLLIPNGVTINEKTNWIPVWNYWFTLFIFFSELIMLIPTIYFIKKKIDDISSDYKHIKKGWTRFLIGVIIYGTGIQYIIIRYFFPEFVFIALIYNTISTTIGAIIMYYALTHEFNL